MSKFAYPTDHKKDVLTQLVGIELDGGWKVTEQVTRLSIQSGSCFSVGYIAQRGDDRAFMKLFDFWDAMQKPDPIAELKNLADTYLFERELLDLCKGANKIVRAIANGVIKDSRAPMGQLFYLLFELADGDVRRELAISNRTDLAWRMRCLHQVATALAQLHKRGIFHQDIKPSNVLVFNNGRTSKLADLGRAHCASRAAPHDSAKIPGAFRYAPPELLYGSPLADAGAQRAASDLYLFGSMISFFVTGLPFTTILLDKLSPAHAPFVTHGGWRGFFRDVLPFLWDAHEAAIREIADAFLAELPKEMDKQKVLTQFTASLRYTTCPDPAQRGHPSARRVKHGNPYSLERFQSGFNLLATLLERELRVAHA